MVLNLPRRTALTPVLVVPDEQSWAAWGVDLAQAGFQPAFTAQAARGLVVPGRLPGALVGALATYREQLAEDVSVHELPSPMGGGGPSSPTATPDAHDHGGDHPEDHGVGHGAHDHHADMMAIVGDPSSDGLVMESVDVAFGPLGTPLPGGLAVRATLDGDVVTASAVEALLVAPPTLGTPAPPDLLSPVAWDLALWSVHEDPQGGREVWAWLIAVEIERAVSHTAWLRAFSRLLGWSRPVDPCTQALSSLLMARSLALVELMPGSAGVAAPDLLASELSRARTSLATIVDLLARSRSLRLRLAGHAPITEQQVRDLGLRGPVARASGVGDDVRSSDPRYSALGFEPVTRTEGDALARTLLRSEEALDAIALALEICAVATRHTPTPTPTRSSGAQGVEVEGPRGPLSARLTDAGWHLDSPGARPALRAAEAAMIGEEWAAALVALASFDPSAWQAPA